MALAAWHPLLPLPLIAGNAREIVDLSQRSTIPGPPVARPRCSSPQERCPVSWVMDDDHLAVWDAYWHFTLSQGCAWVLLLLNGEMGAVPTAARFSAGYSATYNAGLWTVSAMAELDRVPVLSPADYAGMYLAGSLPLPAASLHTLLHTTYRARVLP